MKKLRECRLNLVGVIDLSFAQPLPEILGRDVEVHDLVRLSDDPVRDRLADRDAELALEHVVERLEMLHVHGGDDVDALVEQQHHVLPALAVPRARDIGVRQLVDDRDLAAAGAITRVDIHLLQGHAAILDLLARHDLEIADLRVGLRALVRSRRIRRRRPRRGV